MGRVTIRVVPRASRDEVAGMDDADRVRVRITAPPVEGEANRALIRFLAGVLGVPRGAVSIAAGTASRTKVVEVAELGDADLRERLLRARKKQ